MDSPLPGRKISGLRVHKSVGGVVAGILNHVAHTANRCPSYLHIAALGCHGSDVEYGFTVRWIRARLKLLEVVHTIAIRINIGRSLRTIDTHEILQLPRLEQGRCHDGDRHIAR